ncbi:MAG: tetratricopeptide repeat protein, partial [Planctomycetota bacterium]
MEIVATLFSRLGVTTLFADNIKESKSCFKQGVHKWISQNYPGAIQDLSKAIELNPKYAKAYYWRGLTKIKLQD